MFTRRRPPRDAPADARDPRVRGARRRAVPRRRGAGLRAPVDRAGGVGRRRVLAARPGRRDHVDASRPRPLPREGPRPARDVRRADGARTRARTAGAAGSMHIADPTIGIFGANGIVGAGLPIAAGAATAAQLRRDGSVAVAFFGDGAVAHGTFHEAVNLAAVWQLPVIFFCENNGYAEFSPASTQHAAPLERRAAGYGVDYVAVDGNDVVATAAAMQLGGRGDARRTRSRRRRGGDLPLARSLRRRPAALPISRRSARVGSARPAARPRAPAPIGGHHRRHARSRCSRRSRASSTTPSRPRGACRRRRPRR